MAEPFANQAAEQRLQEARTQAEQTEDNMAARTQELAATDERLDAAGAQEAQIRQTIAQLTKDAADLSAEVAELEPRMQEARDAEAAAQQEIANTREQLTSSLDEARTPSNAQQSWAPGTSNLPRISRRRNSGAPRSRHS